MIRVSHASHEPLKRNDPFQATSSPVLGTFVLRTFVTPFNRRSGSHISLCINNRHSERICILVTKTSVDATAAIDFFDVSERKLRDYIMLDSPNVLFDLGITAVYQVCCICNGLGSYYI